MTDPRKFKAPYNPKERIWQEADRLRAAHPAGRSLPVKVLDLAEFDLGLDLIPANGLREQLDIDVLNETFRRIPNLRAICMPLKRLTCVPGSPWENCLQTSEKFLASRAFTVKLSNALCCTVVNTTRGNL